MSDILKQIAENLGATLTNGNYLSGIADYYGVDITTSKDLMADILTEVGGNPATSTDYLQDIVLELGGTVTINGNWMEAWEAITAGPALFTTEWTTTSSSETIELPYDAAGTYSGTINWGDSNTSANSYANRTHTYAAAGTYEVVVDGDCIGWNFQSAGSPLYLTSVVHFAQLQLGADSGGYFYGCSNLDLSSVSDTLDLTGVTNLNFLFADCTSLTTINNINSWDTSAITSMRGMFQNCTLFNQALSFDTSSVTNMRDMFNGADAFDQNIGTWDVENVTNFSDFMITKTDATFSTTNLNAIYNGWSTQSVHEGITIDFGTANYTDSSGAGRFILVDTYGWNITDGGEI